LLKIITVKTEEVVPAGTFPNDNDDIVADVTSVNEITGLGIIFYIPPFKNIENSL